MRIFGLEATEILAEISFRKSFVCLCLREMKNQSNREELWTLIAKLDNVRLL